MMRYIAIAGLVCSLGLSGVAWWQHARAQRLASTVAILTAKNENCTKRVSDILEAQSDAEEVDNWSDLSKLPDGWLLPDAGAAH